MEKIKITREQEEAFKKLGSGFMTNKQKLSGFVNHKPYDSEVLSPLNDLTNEEFMKLLCGWYEVEQPFKVGDWAYEKQTDRYLKVIQEYTGKKRTVTVSTINDFSDKVEKVTEPWKIMLLELGRDKSEFNPNDIIVTNREVYKADWLTDKEIIELFNEDLIKEFHAYENRIEVKDNACTQ